MAPSSSRVAPKDECGSRSEVKGLKFRSLRDEELKHLEIRGLKFKRGRDQGQRQIRDRERSGTARDQGQGEIRGWRNR